MTDPVDEPGRLDAGEPLLRLRGAAFGYGGAPVVAGVDLEVRAGEVLGIVGPNGAGKTTLFRGILGLLRPLAGRVERLTDALGYVPQRERLDPVFPLTAAEVVHMGAYGRLRGLRGLRAPERALAQACLARVGLEERGRTAFASLSGGQRQRVLIARALMMRPRLLLLDEPTSGVDREAEGRVLELLEGLRGEGLGVMMVSHHLPAVQRAAREVLWVAGGRVTRIPSRDLATDDPLAGGVGAAGRLGAREGER